MNKERVLAIGTGECGGNIANEMTGFGFDSLAFNTASDDLNKLEKIETKILIGKSGGSGKNRKLSKENFGKERKKIRSILSETFGNSKKEVALIFLGAGGGTGSGSAIIIAEEVKALGKKPIIVPLMNFESEGNITKTNAFLFVADYDKVKSEFPCFIFDNFRDKDSMNKYVAKTFSDLFSKGKECDTVFDFRDTINSIRPGYNYLGAGDGNQIKIHSEVFDKSYSKYATLIKSSEKKEDGHGMLKALNLGEVDRNYYRINSKKEEYIIMLGGMSLNMETMSTLQNIAKDTGSALNKKEEMFSFENVEMNFD